MPDIGGLDIDHGALAAMIRAIAATTALNSPRAGDHGTATMLASVLRDPDGDPIGSLAQLVVGFSHLTHVLAALAADESDADVTGEQLIAEIGLLLGSLDPAPPGT